MINKSENEGRPDNNDPLFLCQSCGHVFCKKKLACRQTNYQLDITGVHFMTDCPQCGHPCFSSVPESDKKQSAIAAKAWSTIQESWPDHVTMVNFATCGPGCFTTVPKAKEKEEGEKKQMIINCLSDQCFRCPKLEVETTVNEIKCSDETYDRRTITISCKNEPLCTYLKSFLRTFTNNAKN